MTTSSSTSSELAQMSADIATLPLPQQLQAYVDELLQKVYHKYTYNIMTKIWVQAAMQDVPDNVILKALTEFPQVYDGSSKHMVAIEYRRNKVKFLLTNRLLRLFRPETSATVRVLLDLERSEVLINRNIRNYVSMSPLPVEENIMLVNGDTSGDNVYAAVYELLTNSKLKPCISKQLSISARYCSWWSVLTDRKCANFRVSRSGSHHVYIHLPLAYQLDAQQLKKLKKDEITPDVNINEDLRDPGMAEIVAAFGHTLDSSMTGRFEAYLGFTFDGVDSGTFGDV